MKLKRDIRSHFKTECIYGTAGEEVTIIKESADGVCIVQNSEGARFSCRKENLTESDEISKSVALPENKPVIRKTKTVKKTSNPSLFN